MSANHKKRLAMPRSWAQPRKTRVWISKPDPCGHPIDMCMSLSVIFTTDKFCDDKISDASLILGAEITSSFLTPSWVLAI